MSMFQHEMPEKLHVELLYFMVNKKREIWLKHCENDTT